MLGLKDACRYSCYAYLPPRNWGKAIESKWTDARCVVARHIDVVTHKEIAVVSFCGTHGIRSWKTNINADLKAHGKGKVHRGHLHEWLSLRDHVHKEVGLIGSDTVAFVGHSSGGICSSIAAVDSTTTLKNIEVITFGAPPTGDQNFAKEIESKVNRLVRVVKGRDVIPTLPLGCLGYVHAGQLLYLPSDACKMDISMAECIYSRLVAPVTDHGLTEYMVSLRNIEDF